MVFWVKKESTYQEVRHFQFKMHGFCADIFTFVLSLL